VNRIKRISYEVLDKYKSKFGEDFADNKKMLNEVSIVRSKSLKNKIAGYITKFIKKEVREEKSKQALIISSQSEESEENQVQAGTSESTIIPKETTETVADTTPVEEKTETVADTTPVEEKTETVADTTPVEEKTE